MGYYFVLFSTYGSQCFLFLFIFLIIFYFFEQECMGALNFIHHALQRFSVVTASSSHVSFLSVHVAGTQFMVHMTQPKTFNHVVLWFEPFSHTLSNKSHSATFMQSYTYISHRMHLSLHVMVGEQFMDVLVCVCLFVCFYRPGCGDATTR